MSSACQLEIVYPLRFTGLNKNMIIHDDIAKYIKFMKSFTVWHGTIVTWDNTPYDRCRRFYTNKKWVLLIILFLVVGASLYLLDDFGLFDGTFIYWPICLMMVVLTCITTFSGQLLDVLMKSLNDHFLENAEPWKRAIKDKYIKSLWKFITFYNTYNNSLVTVYILGPLVADTILHFGFDYLERPLTLPMPLSPLLRYNDAWNAKHYIVTLINYWALLEVVFTLQWFIGSFSLLATFVLTELIIFKHQVKSLNFEKDDELEQQVENIVNKHNKIIRLSNNLKNYLGLSGAFISFFTSVSLTFTAFTMFTSSNIVLRLSYSTGFSLYFSAALLYSTLGQKLESESEEVFTALYDLRWYRFKPNARKSLNMMMRQARTPLIIDYHGHYKMNLENFMQILRSFYSYFTLLQSVASRTSN